MKKYTSVTIAYNPKKQDYSDIQRAVETALEDRFPSFEADGGGSMLGFPERDIFFSINYGSLNKVEPYLRKKGFKVV